jgi:hypothetical protein
MNINRGFSDHNMILTRIRSKGTSKIEHCMKKRSMKNFDKDVFSSECSNVNWDDVTQYTDVNLAVSAFTDKINNILDKIAPTKVTQPRVNFAAWLTENTAEMMKKRDMQKELAQRSNEDFDWELFKKLRNSCVSAQKKDKRIWRMKQYEKCLEEKDPSKLWRCVKKNLGWGNAGPPRALKDGNGVTRSPRRIAQLQNKYFVDKVKNIRINLAPQTEDPTKVLEDIMVKWDGKDTRGDKFQLREVSEEEILGYLVSLKNSQAEGVDTVSSVVLKAGGVSLVRPLAHITNLSISTSTFPNKWRIARSSPLYKGSGDVLEMANYRPVVFLPAASKLVEMAVTKQIIEYMMNTGQMTPNQHAYREGHSTTTAIGHLLDTWIEAAECGEHSGVMYADMSCAFDLVDPDILESKLRLYNISESTIKWLNTYLRHRSQVITIGGVDSDPLHVEVGVPQGSILGPLLYTIYTNEMLEVILRDGRCIHDVPEYVKKRLFRSGCRHCGMGVCYADDSTVSVSGIDSNVTEASMNRILSSLSSWLSNNKLKINEDKTHIQKITTRQREMWRREETIELITAEKIIQTEETCRLLGADISSDFTWSHHLVTGPESLVKQLNKRIGGLKKLRGELPENVLLAIANGIFMSKLSYLITIWGGASIWTMKKIQAAQYRAARAVISYNRGLSRDVILKKCGWMDVVTLAKYHSQLQVWKAVHEGFPVYLSDWIKVQRLRGRNNRSGDDLKVPVNPTGLALVRNSWKWRSLLEWNNLPSALRNITKIGRFKKVLKLHYFNDITGRQ